MSKMSKLFALSAGMMALAMNNGIIPAKKTEAPKKSSLTDKERERIRKKYASEQHEYVIKGVKIVAPNKKVAIKIYNLLNLKK